MADRSDNASRGEEDPVHLPSTNLPERAVGCWTRDRQEILRWLGRHAPPLAELYESTVLILFVFKIPARGRIVAHGVREIGNNLAKHFGSAVRGQVRYQKLISDLLPQWKGAGLPVGEPLVNVAAEKGDPQTDRAVPIPLVNLISELLGEHENGKSRVRERAKDLFMLVRKEEGASEAQLFTAIQQWVGVCRWFVERVHRDVSDKELLTEEFFRQFEIFERILHTLAANFFDVVEGLDEILDEANR